MRLDALSLVGLLILGGFLGGIVFAVWVQRRVRIRVHRLRVAVVKPRLPS